MQETQVGGLDDVQMAGVARLRSSRGDQQVSFDDIADHMRDFVSASPVDRGAVERFASFLVTADRTEHSHDGPLGSSLKADDGG